MTVAPRRRGSVAIIGTGRLGTRIAEELLSADCFDTVFLWNRSLTRLNGTLLALRIWRELRRITTKVAILDWSLFSRVDLVVIAAKDSYDPRDLIESEVLPAGVPRNLRYIGLLRDLPEIQMICRRLVEYRGVVLVATNPVDVITTIVAGLLPGCLVLGLGCSVDSARLAFILRELHGARLEPEKLLVGGEHGGELVALKSFWPHDSKVLENPQELRRLFGLAAKLGFELVSNLGYTSYDSALVFSRDIRWVLRMDTTRKTAVFSSCDDAAAIGRPCCIATDGILPIGISKSENVAIQHAARKIGRIVDILRREGIAPCSIGSPKI